VKYFIAGTFLLASQTAFAFEPFNFEVHQQTIKCVRKPGTDYLTCTYEPVEEDPTPVVEPTPEPAPPETYFELVEGAFPGDPSTDFVFFTDTPVVKETLNAWGYMREIDIDGDGVQELIQTFNKQVKTDNNTSTSEHEENQIIAWDFRDTAFVNVTDEYFDDTDMECHSDSMESKDAEIDINQDGQIDFFYSCNHEDGALRLAEDGGYHAQLVGFISQFDGKYKMYKFGDEKWWHSVGVGMDEDGVPYVHGAGGVPDGIQESNDQGSRGNVKYTNALVQNERYYYDYNADEMVTENSYKFPDIFSGQGGPLEISRYDDYTDLLVQRPTKLDMQDFASKNNWEWPLYALQAYYLDEPYGKWQRSEMFQMDYKSLGKIDYVAWTGALKKRDILEIDGYVAMANSGGLDPNCELTLYPDQEPVILTTMSIDWLPGWTPDVTLIDSTDPELDSTHLWVQKLYLMDFQNQEIINLGGIEIDGESPVFGGNFGSHLGAQCMDVNQDGYDDIVVDSNWVNEWRTEYPEEREGLIWKTYKGISVFINQQDGTFSNLDMQRSDDINISDVNTGFTATTISGDYDGDGILDVVSYFTHAGYYMGPNTLEMRFYKGTGKILEDQ